MTDSVEFKGSFQITPPLSHTHAAYLRRFSHTRHMKRDADKTADLIDVLRVEAHLPVGEEGGYYVGTADQDALMQTYSESSLLDVNEPPKGQPGLWCDWEPNQEGNVLGWNGAEKFRNYIPWLEYLIEHFMKRWGYTLNGEVVYHDEDDEKGRIVVKDNVILY